MPSGSHSQNVQIGGAVFTRSANLTADNSSIYGDASAPIVLAAAVPTLTWVKVDADEASGTFTDGHGIIDGEVNVYWNGGVQYGVTIDVTTNSFTIAAGGLGTDFPANGTQCYIAQEKILNIAIDGDLAEMIGILADVRAFVSFHDVDHHVIRAVELQEDEPDCWDSDMAENPYTGDIITHAHYTQGTIVAGTLKIAVLQDSTP